MSFAPVTYGEEMESTEISALAKTHAEAIFAHELTKAELVMLVACIDARVKHMIQTEAIHKVEAPLPAAPVKATPIATGQKIAEKGYPCVCIMCNKHIYTLNRDLYENTTVKEFIEAYTPMPGFAPITRQTKISNVDNNITTNCVSCNSELSLYLAGKVI